VSEAVWAINLFNHLNSALFFDRDNLFRFRLTIAHFSLTNSTQFSCEISDYGVAWVKSAANVRWSVKRADDSRTQPSVTMLVQTLYGATPWLRRSRIHDWTKHPPGPTLPINLGRNYWNEFRMWLSSVPYASVCCGQRIYWKLVNVHLREVYIHLLSRQNGR